MRHSRAQAFQEALVQRVPPGTVRWTDVADDPNDPAALAHRAARLRAAWRGPIADRIAFLEERCRHRRVLDIGCVAHDVARMDSPEWLHGRLARVASHCVGVDVLEDGVREMQARGFTVLAHDLATGLGPVAEYAPFDVIVAGELIEHVEHIGVLFELARTALRTDGQLVVTTPNPYAPHRVRAAQLGVVWENVDHILYAFPSGVAELAERYGLMLAEAATVDNRIAVRGLKARLRTWKRRALGRQWRNVGFASLGPPRSVSVGPDQLQRNVWRVLGRRRRFLGETFVYVIRHPPRG
jgi:2-polyprenyl-3-methyl-5-hydroxy-6-metoxy-1,4-benzoquinol methylase